MSGLDRIGGIPTGKDIEFAVLGPSLAMSSRMPEYQTRGDAITTLLKAGPIPSEKMSVFAKELVTYITRAAYKAGLGHIKFRSALGTSLDIHHGVDALFATERGAVVTLDVTANEEKTVHKADIIVHVGIDGEGNVLFNDDQRAELSKRITTLLKERDSIH